MQEYLDSKVAEYSILFKWIESEINRLRSENKNHAQLIDTLQDNFKQLQESYERLKAIINLKSERLVQRAIPIIHDIEYQILVLTYYYIPGLQRENANDLFFRNVVLSVLQRCGLSWVEDVLVRLDSHHAIFPAVTEMPILFAPPQHVKSASDMAAIYHELGHDVFQHFPDILQNLSRAIFGYFSELRLSIGSMSPEKRSERNKMIDSALAYWSAERVNELFSDIYATFVCGPAHYFCSVDVAIRMGRNPFHINVADVHPPWAARINACYNMLLPVYQNGEEVELIRRVWNSYASSQPKDKDYNFFYSEDLIKQLVDVAIWNIEQYVPNTQRYSKSLQCLAKADPLKEKNLENILNARLVLLLSEPAGYEEWEKKVFSVLGT
jgi:hypothetical protein